MSDRKAVLQKINVIQGMGSMVQPQGVAFRVWAPHAESVSVVGTFNQWDPLVCPMQKEEGGTWYAYVDQAEEGHGYLYHIRNGEDEFTRPDPRAREMENSVGNSLIWKPKPEAAGEVFKAPLMNEMVIYEMHIGSFNRPTEGGVGTFATAIEKLGYLRDLGINTIEIMPIAEFAGDLSWGYNPACPYAVESAYGGPNGLLSFVKAAHEHGIAVIVDVVYNHFGPSDLGLWQFDGWSENGKGGIYFYNDHRSSTPWGDSRPDYGRGEVRSYIRDNALMWFEEYAVDGLRWDMTVFIRSCQGNPGDPHDDLAEGWGLMQWVNDEIHAKYPHAITIAEDLRDSEWLVKGTGAGGAGFSSQWNADFVHPVRAVMIQSEDEHRSLKAIETALNCRFDGDAFKRVIYSESHDEVANGKARLPTEIVPDDAGALPARQRACLAATLVYTAPGIPMIFQGQEFLTDEWFRDDVPLDWSRTESFNGVLLQYQDLAKMRRNLSGNTAGLMGQHIHVHHVEEAKKVIGFRRWLEGGAGDDVVVILNLSHQAVDDIRVGVPAPGSWRVRFHSDAQVYGGDLAGHPCVDAEAVEGDWDGQPYSIHLALGGYASAIFSQDPT
jgi:1,4-alpha-glucan branching enzyme